MLIPLKARAVAKQRLAAVLSDLERLMLVEQMLGLVINAARAARFIDAIAIVTSEPLQAPANLIVLRDPGDGLNAALETAAAVLSRDGIDELVVLPADLPTLGGAAIEQLVTAGRRTGIALAPNRHRTGTNGLYTRLPTSLRFSFGPCSWQVHLASAQQIAQAEIVLAPELLFDIDEPADLVAWQHYVSVQANPADTEGWA